MDNTWSIKRYPFFKRVQAHWYSCKVSCAPLSLLFLKWCYSGMLPKTLRIDTLKLSRRNTFCLAPFSKMLFAVFARLQWRHSKSVVSLGHQVCNDAFKRLSLVDLPKLFKTAYFDADSILELVFKVINICSFWMCP